MQLSAVEKTEIRKSLKRGSSQTEMDRVVSEWNEKHPERKIDSGHVKRLRDQPPAFDNADAFWQSQPICRDGSFFENAPSECQGRMGAERSS